MNRVVGYLLIFIVFCACSRVPFLGLKSHIYGKTPKNIIFFQIPGLSHSQIAMIRFAQVDARQKSSFGEMSCTGNMWAYNFYEIRPTSRNSMLSQLTGNKDMKSTCADYDKKPLWEYLESKNLMSLIVETKSSGNSSLLESLKCKNDDFLKNVTFFSMTKSKDEGANSFHFQKQIPHETGVYYDKTCDGKRCFATFLENVKSIIKSLEKDNDQKKVIILRNFEYLKSLQQKDITQSKQILFEINSLLDFLLQWAKVQKETLVLVGGSQPIRIEFPAKGAEWRKFERSGDFVQFRKSDLWSPLYAYGAGAEKFCGIMEESSLIDRLLLEPSGRRFSLDFLDAF